VLLKDFRPAIRVVRHSGVGQQLVVQELLRLRQLLPVGGVVGQRAKNALPGEAAAADARALVEVKASVPDLREGPIRIVPFNPRGSGGSR
jgi:hypothetical protein